MRILNIQDVSERTGIPAATLRWYRHQGDVGPKSFKLGPKRIAYKEDDVEKWIAEQYATTATK